MSRHRLPDVKDGSNVSLQEPLKSVRREIMQFRPVLHPCVVDEDVDAACRGLKAIHGCPDRVMIRRVKCQLMYDRAFRRQLSCCR